MAATSLQRSAWSDIWTYTIGPGIGASRVTRTPRPTRVADVDLEVSYAIIPGEQGIFAFEPRLDVDPLLLAMGLDVGGVIRWRGARTR